jgi:hypothetical protein
MSFEPILKSKLDHLMAAEAAQPRSLPSAAEPLQTANIA